MKATLDDDAAAEILTADPARTGVFTDFDGTLSPIVASPDDARPVDGAIEVLESLAAIFGVVGIISGRSLEDLRARCSPAGVVLAGSYGRERSDGPRARRATEGWETVAVAARLITRELDGVVLERKGAGIGLHYRAAPHHAQEVRRRAEALAEEFELELRPGRKVVELVKPGPGKGDALANLASHYDIDALAMVGDDIGDLEAFDWARASGLRAVTIGVRSDEAPADLEDRVDLMVDGPAAVVAFLKRLATPSRR